MSLFRKKETPKHKCSECANQEGEKCTAWVSYYEKGYDDEGNKLPNQYHFCKTNRMFECTDSSCPRYKAKEDQK